MDIYTSVFMDNSAALAKRKYLFNLMLVILQVRKRYRREVRNKLDAKAKALWERSNRNSESTSGEVHRNASRESAAASHVAEEGAAHEADNATSTPGVAEQNEADEAAVSGGKMGGGFRV